MSSGGLEVSLSIYIQRIFISVAPKRALLLTRLLAAEEMPDEKNISALESVDLYGLILSMLGNSCRLLVFFECELLSKYSRLWR